MPAPAMPLPRPGTVARGSDHPRRRRASGRARRCGPAPRTGTRDPAAAAPPAPGRRCAACPGQRRESIRPHRPADPGAAAASRRSGKNRSARRATRIRRGRPPARRCGSRPAPAGTATGPRRCAGPGSAGRFGPRRTRPVPAAASRSWPLPAARRRAGPRRPGCASSTGTASRCVPTPGPGAGKECRRAAFPSPETPAPPGPAGSRAAPRRTDTRPARRRTRSPSAGPRAAPDRPASSEAASRPNRRAVRSRSARPA